MARYEGMEELLQLVRERLGVQDAEMSASQPTAGAQTEDRSARYADTLEALLLQLRDAEQLRELLVELSLLGLTRDQYDDLTSILGKVMRELWQCKTALERAEPGA